MTDRFRPTMGLLEDRILPSSVAFTFQRVSGPTSTVPVDLRRPKVPLPPGLPLPLAKVPFDAQVYQPSSLKVADPAMGITIGPPGAPPDQAPQAVYSNSCGLSIGSREYEWVTAMGGP